MSVNFANACRTRLAGAIDNVQTTLTVANGTGFPDVDFHIRIGTEIMLVTAKSGNDWTVTRAVEAVQGIQAAAAHADKSTVKHDLTAGAIAGLGGGGVSFDVAMNLFIGGGGTDVAADIIGFAGYDNIGIGAGSIDGDPADLALGSITDGAGNTALGPSTLTDCTTGSYNVAIGTQTLYRLTTGGSNTGVGAFCLSFVTTGNGNTAFGIGGLAQVTGDDNTAIGDGAGGDHGGDSHGVTSGTGNTFLGAIAQTVKATISGGIAIGYKATVRNDNQCVIGGNANDSPAGPPVCLIWSGATAPADGDLVASQGSVYWDFTNGAPALKVKLKTADGTVVTKTLTWS